MQEILETIRKQIEQLEKLQEKFLGTNTNVERTIEISAQINELTKTALEIKRSNQPKRVTVLEEPFQKLSWEEISRDIAANLADYAAKRAAEIRAEREAKCGKAQEDQK